MITKQRGLRGRDKLSKQLRAVRQQFPQLIIDAFEQEAPIELSEMKRRTPVDTGDLQNSLYFVVSYNGNTVVVLFISEVFYAVFVHENLEALHPNGGEAKFMESVLNESASFWPTRIARRIGIGLVQMVDV